MNNKKILSFFQQKTFRFFMLALFVSLLMWFMINLSKEYTKTVPVKITFKKIAPGYLINCKDTIVITKIQGTGFSLWSNSLKKKQYAINVKDNKKTWNWQQNQYAFQQLFPKNIKVLNVIPATISFTPFKLLNKKVKVQYQIKLQPQLGYGVTEYKLQPDSVTVYGYETVIKDIKTIKTDSLLLNNVVANVSGKVRLQIPEKVLQVSEKEISYQYTIERYTQGKFLVPIQLVNVPENSNVTIFPKQVRVQFESPLSLFENYQSEHFMLTVDCSNLENKTTLPIVLKEIPDGMKNVRVLKKSVTFLVLKK